jgi:hypothetical protein
VQSSGDSAWKDVLTRLWTRLKLGPLPAGGRDDRWDLTVDGRTLTLRVAPDERGLVASVEAFRLDEASASRDISVILRRDLGFLHTDGGGLRLFQDDRGAALLVEDLIPVETPDAEVDRIMTRMIERAAVHAAATKRSAAVPTAPRRAERARDDAADIIFRP